MTPQIQNRLDIYDLIDEFVVTRDVLGTTDAGGKDAPRCGSGGRPGLETSTAALENEWPELRRPLLAGLRKCLAHLRLAQ